MNVNSAVQYPSDATPPLLETSSVISVSESRRLLLWVAALVVAADWLLWGEKYGLGVSVFGVVCGVALFWNRPRGAIDTPWLAVSGLALASLVQSAVAPSDFNRIVLAVLFSVGMVDSELRQTRARLAGFGAAASAWFHCLPRVGTFLRSLQIRESAETPHASASRMVSILFPALLLLSVFLFLLGQGNAVLAHSFNAIGTRLSEWLRQANFPSPVRIAFWMAAAIAAVTFVWPRPTGSFLGTLTRPWSRFEPPAEVAISRWRSVAILAALNLAYLANNLLDIHYLWMGAGLPKGVTFSAYVHEGSNWLIAAAVIAGAVITFLFQQDTSVTHRGGLRALALFWIAQNLAMAGGVILRLKLYVDAYDLTLARIGVVCFVVLVAVGFCLLAWKVAFNKSLNWLVLGNAFAVFILFFGLQFVDLAGYTARHNTQQWLDHPLAKLDIDYLAKLGPPAWPSLKRIAESQRWGNFPKVAADELDRARQAQEGRNLSWQSWTWRGETLQKEVFSK